MCVAYLGNTLHYDALWEEVKLAEAVYCWETLGPASHVVTLTRSTFLSMVAEPIYPLIVFPDGCGLLQQDNAHCHRK